MLVWVAFGIWRGDFCNQGAKLPKTRLMLTTLRYVGVYFSILSDFYFWSECYGLAVVDMRHGVQARGNHMFLFDIFDVVH